MSIRRLVRLMLCGVSAVSLAGLAAGPATLHGQDPAGAPQATFRATTALVQVDVIVLDDDGRFVPGLIADDLVILEDGKRQQIRQFFMVSHDPAARPRAESEALPTLEERSHRVFVLLFDEGHLANDSLMRVKVGAERFIREQIGPGDIAGVFANGGMYKGLLTSDKRVLLAGIQSAKPGFENRQALLAPFREFPRIDSEIDAVRIAEGGRQLVNRVAATACAAEPLLCELQGGVGQIENQIEQKARLYVRQARVLTSQTLQNLQYVSSTLSRIPGRKTVVFMSEGFFVEESRPALQTIAAQAARGGTTFYSIDGRGLINGTSAVPDVVSTDMARSTAFDTGEDGPMLLTATTGGFMLRKIDDISRAFGLIARDTSTYYVIGYQPENSKMDGKYRRIEVKANVAGVSVRARKGYVATPLPPVQNIRGGT